MSCKLWRSLTPLGKGIVVYFAVLLVLCMGAVTYYYYVEINHQQEVPQRASDR
ncbi:hypothetical protein M0Q28_05510 [Patescibacteria group bacterium]|jgi:hypothetical protein|nr:hypothetical protein [Patescibacteria group bacterium]